MVDKQLPLLLQHFLDLRLLLVEQSHLLRVVVPRQEQRVLLADLRFHQLYRLPVRLQDAYYLGNQLVHVLLQPLPPGPAAQLHLLLLQARAAVLDAVPPVEQPLQLAVEHVPQLTDAPRQLNFEGVLQ